MPTPSPFEVPKRPLTWVITGCSSGFGLELVRTAQGNGHFVIATSRNPGRTPELVSEVEAKGGKWLKLDVDDADSATVLETIEKDGHAIDVLVNNAGFALYGSAEQFTENEVRRQFETLFFGPARLSRTAVRYMRERRFGIIVNISSAAAIRHVPTMSIYGAAKAALDNLHKTMAREVKDFNVRILTVNPAVFDTPMESALQIQEAPLEKDYQKQEVGVFLHHMQRGNIPLGGDTKKAVKAIYEVVVGEGVGKGHENQPVLPLGGDMIRFINNGIAQWTETLEVFGEVCKSVDHEKKQPDTAPDQKS